MKKPTFDSKALEFFKLAEKTDYNIFLSWYAGTGKSFTFEYFKSKSKKKIITLGTTGTAAKNVWWYTIHSFLWITKDWKVKNLPLEKKQMIKNADIIAIDEISMWRADLIDRIDFALKKAMWNDKLFWWKQIIFIWDLLQLPPVLVQYEKNDEWEKVETEEYKYFTKNYEGRFFFNAKCYDPNKFKTVILTKVHRQDNINLINALNCIRKWLKNADILNLFNSRVTPKNELDKKAIYIWATNRIVDKINKEKLEENKNETIVKRAIIQWDYEDEHPVDEWIHLKKWCRIMFTSNHKDGLYSNWSLGTFIWEDGNKLTIETDCWLEIKIEKMTWSYVIWQDEIWEDIIWWTFTQYPIKLGHAITIHKSQGKTFDNVIIDTWYGCFEAGMLYVALSRCTNLEWLQLVKPIKANEIFANEEVKKYLEN